jgi:hypothetical protein
MESLSIKRIALVLLTGTLVALVLGGIANAVDLGRTSGSILGATAIALVAGLGVPWALRWRVPMLFERRQQVQTHKTAVIAYKRQSWIALPWDAFVFPDGLDDHRHSGIGPVFYTASGAFATSGPLADQSSFKRIKVSNGHRFDPTTFQPVG